jgi:hypothetical protein
MRGDLIMVKFKTINVDGVEIERNLTVEDFKNDCLSDDCSLPMCDDEVIYAEIDGKKIEAKIFEDVAHAVGVC